MTSSRQHHLQYTGGLAETQGLLLPSVIVTLSEHATLQTDTISSFQNCFKRLLFLLEQSFKTRSAFVCPNMDPQNNAQVPNQQQAQQQQQAQ